MSGVPAGGPGGVVSLSQRARRGPEAYLVARKGSSWTTRRSRSPNRRSGKLGGPPRCPGGSGGPHVGRDGSGVSPGGPGRVGRLMWMAGRGREAHPEVRERSEGPHKGPGEVRGPTRRFGSGRETHPEVQ